MARYLSIPAAARHFHKHSRSIENWLGAHFIHGYDDGSGHILIDTAEVEAQLRVNPRMRDGRKRYGGAIIVPLPVEADAEVES